jgi:16S rRNA (guanine966-N2)-methyltransferase
MRVIAGEWRGARLEAGQSRDLRPLTGRIKESLFGGLGERIDDARVLDLFAGSGSFGIEALSRGARHVVFVENAAQVNKVLNKNLRRLAVALDRYEQLEMAVARALSLLAKQQRSFDIVFADPPFRRPMAQGLLDLLSKRRVLAQTGLLILRHHRKEVMAPCHRHFEQMRSKVYGDSVIEQFMEKP